METARRDGGKVFVGLDFPGNLSTCFSDILPVHGWLYVPEDVNAAHVHLSFVLEELNRPGTTLRAGLVMAGEILTQEQTAERPCLDVVSVAPAARAPETVDPGLQGRLFDVDALVDFRSCVKNSAGGLFSLVMCAEFGSSVVLSNEIHFTVAPEEEWFKARAGYVRCPKEVHSDFLLLEGWAVQRGGEPVEVQMRINERALLRVDIKQPSPTQMRMLPGVEEAKNCLFRTVIFHQEWERQCGKLPKTGALLAINCTVKFSSGDIVPLPLQQVVWSREPQGEEYYAPHGRITAVRKSEEGMLEIEGWTVNAGFNSLRLILQGARKTLTFPAQTGDCEEEKASECYPSLIRSAKPGWKIKAATVLFGKIPGAIELRAENDAGSGRVLEPCAFQHLLGELSESAFPSLLKPIQKLVRKSGLRLKQPDNQAKILKRNGVGGEKKRLLVVSHNLAAVEGAPKVLFAVAARLIQAGIEIKVISPCSGKLIEDYSALGAEVTVIEETGVVGQTKERYWAALEKAHAFASSFKPHAVYANVIDSFWAVDYAHRSRIPSLWAIHESVDPLSGFLQLGPELRLTFLHQLAHANKLIFVSRQTAKLFASCGVGEKAVIIPNAVDAGKIAAKRSATSRQEARSRLGIPADAVVVSVIGTTTYRKGQDIFLREMALLKHMMPERVFRFYVVGARRLPFLEELEALVQTLQLEQEVVFVPEQPEISDYYIVSDVIALPSREESAPLVSLEAFAYEVPLVSSLAFGLAEQIKDEENALAFDLHEKGTLARQAGRLLMDEGLREKLIRGARESTESDFSFSKCMDRYVEEVTKLLCLTTPADEVKHF